MGDIFVVPDYAFAQKSRQIGVEQLAIRMQ
jgi:hypothetical protein